MTVLGLAYLAFEDFVLADFSSPIARRREGRQLGRTVVGAQVSLFSGLDLCVADVNCVDRTYRLIHPGNPLQCPVSPSQTGAAQRKPDCGMVGAK